MLSNSFLFHKLNNNKIDLIYSLQYKPLYSILILIVGKKKMKFVKLAHCLIFSFFIVVFNLLHRINQIKFMFPHNTVISIQYHCIINKYTHSIISRTHWYPNINAILVRTCIISGYTILRTRVACLGLRCSLDSYRLINCEKSRRNPMNLSTCASLPSSFGIAGGCGLGQPYG